MGYFRRQLVTGALVANALRPVPGLRVGIPSFFAGWLTGELAPQLLALTAADTAGQVARGRREPARLALGAAVAGGLVVLVRRGRSVREQVEEALVRDLGLDRVEDLDDEPSPAEVALPWRRLVNPFRMADPTVHVRRDIPYSDAGRRGMLDVYAPAGGELSGAPVLLQVHGGGWSIGRKDQQGQLLMHRLAAKGWVCVAINYRLAPRDAFPAHIVDVKRAIAWIREHIAEYGGDPDYLAITGGSAGGHLAALAALTPNDPAWQPGFEDVDTSVRVAVPFYGVYDMAGATGLRSVRDMRDRFLAPHVLQAAYDDAPELFEAASPILRVTEDAPDFFVIHGVHDTLVSVRQARRFVDRLREVSRRTVVYAELPGAQHAFDVFTSIRSTQVVAAVDRYLHWHWNRYRRANDVQVEDTREQVDA